MSLPHLLDLSLVVFSLLIESLLQFRNLLFTFCPTENKETKKDLNFPVNLTITLKM